MADGSMGNYVDDCRVCFTAFDDTVQRPRSLPCGHIFCTPCLNGLVNQGQVPCPICRVEYAVPETGSFPVCYALEDVIRRVKRAAVSSPPRRPGKDKAVSKTLPVTAPGQKQPAGLSRRLQSLLQDQEAKVLDAITTCREVQAQLDHYHTTLVSWGDQQQQLEFRFVNESKSARALLRQEKCQVATKKEQVLQGEKQLHTMLQTLRSVSTGRDAYQAIDDAEHCTDEEQERVKECRAVFPDGQTVTTVRRAMAASRAAVKTATAGAAGHPILTVNPVTTITEKLEVLLAPTLEAEDLRTLTQPTRNLLLAGLVFATHNTEGQSRHASISLKDGRQYLHSLKNQTLPPGAVTLQMDEVVPAAPPCLVFLDLAWPGSASRRVLVRLSPDTPLARQFVLLCTGQRGPSYVNTSLFGVYNKGQPGEVVGGGDYEGRGGMGGAALLPDLDNGDYRQSGRAGDVCRAYRVDKSDMNARFGILTRDSKEGVVFSYVFGEVVDGLEVLAAAAQHSPITEVTVVDCGVVLWS